MNADEIKKISRDKLTVGYREVVRAARNGELRCVLLADDCDEGMNLRLAALTADKKLKIHHFASRRELGVLLGLDVGCGVAGIRK